MGSDKHTAGPWVYLDLGEVVMESNFEVTIAAIDYGRDNAEDDGNLIAAAPDMLAALLSAQAALSDGGFEGLHVDAALREIDMALSKATGAQS